MGLKVENVICLYMIDFGWWVFYDYFIKCGVSILSFVMVGL